MADRLAIAHYVSLSELGGVERQFRRFAETAERRSGVRQSAVICSKRIHLDNRVALAALADHRFEKSVFGHTLPRHPKALRVWRGRWIARHQNPDVSLLWNRLGQQARVLDALGARRCLYWEHGSAWLYGEAAAKRAVLARLPAVICNSFAARRMLELHWHFDGRIRVCPNGLPRTGAPAARTDIASPLRLGMAARLVPIKAVCVGLHTLAALVRGGADARLTIAGDGPLYGELEQQARALGLANRVRFAGSIADMDAFFSGIDMFLHTALREPFGMVAAEAQAAGVPVICAAVDGLPEVVRDGETGCCVAPTGDLERHRALGGHNEGLPPRVYDPVADRIIEPRVCEPAALAEVVSRLAADPGRYRAMSEAGIAHVAARFDLQAHVDRVLAAAREYRDTGTLEAA